MKKERFGRKTKKVIFWSAICLGLVFIFAYYYYTVYLPTATVLRLGYEMSGKTVDESLLICEQEAQENKGMCIFSICASNSKKTRDACLLMASLKNSEDSRVANGTLCEMMAYQQTKDSCYYHIAVKYNNTDFCNMIADETSRNLCFGFREIQAGLASNTANRNNTEACNALSRKFDDRIDTISSACEKLRTEGRAPFIWVGGTLTEMSKTYDETRNKTKFTLVFKGTNKTGNIIVFTESDTPAFKINEFYAFDLLGQCIALYPNTIGSNIFYHMSC